MNCYEGWDEINWSEIDSKGDHRKVVTEEYHVENPAWVIEKEQKESNKNKLNIFVENHYLSNQRTKRQTFDNKEVVQEINYNKDLRFNIPNSCLKYGEIFTADTRKSFGKLIKNEDNKIICHRHHIKRICDSNCRLKDSHKKVSQENKKSLLEFVEFCFNCHFKLKESSSKNRSKNNQS